MYFIEKCYRDDPDIDECLKYSGNKLASYLHEGIPELDLVDVEPVIVDGKQIINKLKTVISLMTSCYVDSCCKRTRYKIFMQIIYMYGTVIKS